MGNSWKGIQGTEWTYTPIIVGFGTSGGVTTGIFTYTRIGNRCKGMGHFTVGTPTGVLAKIGLPPTSAGSASYLTSDSGLISSTQVCGNAIYGGVGNAAFYMLTEPAINYVAIGVQTSANNAFQELAGNFANPGAILSIQFEVPITGWNL